jgi:hypothetical protein
MGSHRLLLLFRKEAHSRMVTRPAFTEQLPEYRFKLNTEAVVRTVDEGHIIHKLSQ